ncbi:ATP-binding protein [Labrys wisconsinensis]|uniref:histidine kinase n=1 Tax=Labrys wisconsinensis TaxID=425677 RepID=A0ABU0JJN5_9HYPH|nr:ATP-binding protein [Labrys wisconsinensis]MDQ0473701.1 two-component system osmolarity sensor histidine kinase EnvZ [Labrys wisconsinensis]
MMLTRSAAWLKTSRFTPSWREILAVPGRGLSALGDRMPKGLYARSLLIIITPIVILQAVLAYVFMEKHWQSVTARLSAATTKDIAAIIELYQQFPHDPQTKQKLERIAQDKLALSVEFRPLEDLPPAGPKPFFSILDQALSDEITQRIARPFWIDTVGRSDLVEIRIKLEDTVVRVFARRNQTYASNSHIFLVWMVGSSLILMTVAVLFLRNQIRPIQQLATAAEAFGKGRDVANFRPRGAREVRQAASAFIEMRRRVERAIEQRTTMLNGVSHDLRTILTRFKLSLALMGEDNAETQDLIKDVDEMSRMLEAYLAFARGDAVEQASATDIAQLLEELRADAQRHGHETRVSFHGDPRVTVRPDAFKRCLANLVSNAQRFGDDIVISGLRETRYLTVHVDDDGPGVPESQREEVFKPFVRLDEGRNQDHAGTGLGLAIARDIARGHGGDVVLARSPLGGLRASVRVPV